MALSAQDQAAVIKAAQQGGLSTTQGQQIVGAANNNQTINVSQPNPTPQALSTTTNAAQNFVSPTPSTSASSASGALVDKTADGGRGFTYTPTGNGSYAVTDYLGRSINTVSQLPASLQSSQPTTTQPTQATTPTTATTAPATSTTPAVGTQTTQSLTMPANGSVVDLLNAAGQDSSFAARTQLAQQYGIKGYTGTAAQNTELAKKFTEMYNSTKGTTVPQNSAEARSALQAIDESQNALQADPTQQFMDTYASMDPVQKSIYDTINQITSYINTRTSLQDEISQLPEFKERANVKAELLDVKRIMDGSEQDIRDEITNAGGFATESQVQALTGARNKVLLKQANSLTDQFNVLNDYVNQITDLTKADRAQVMEDMQTKLGLVKTLFDMQQTMQNAAKENYNQIVNQIGYDGLVQNITSQQDLNKIASALGMSPSTLLQLSTVQTSAERQMALQEANYQLSVDKFNEDKRQFGLQYALNQQKVATQSAAAVVASPYQVERSTRTLQSVKELLPKVSSYTVGPGSLLANIPGTIARDFAAEVDTLKSNIIAGELTAMREASKTGGALGAISDKESAFLSSSLGALDTGQSPDNFKAQLQKVQDSIYRWNAQVLSVSNNFDYQAAKSQGYSDEEIFNYLNQ